MKTLPLIIALFSAILPAPAAPATTAFPANGANYARFPSARPPLLPMPQQVEWGNAALPLERARALDASALSPSERKDALFARILEELQEFLQAHEVADAENGFLFQVKKGTPRLPEGSPDWRLDEAYELEITPKGAVITTRGLRGLRLALQTVKQLIIRRKGKTTIAQCRIIDWPDLQIRAFMNDIGRNFMPPELIKQEIDSIALLKYNAYHLHLSDAPGWRLESKIHPRLNRAENMTRQPGKYLTQKQFKDLVEYCRARGVLLIPEIDMPGHCAAFRKALKIDDMKDPRATEALEGLIAELASLVPAEQMPFIHIGTDEARNANEKVTEDILKRYFHAVEKAGRTPIRWQPGLSPKGYTGAIEHLWMGRGARKSWPTPGGRYLDSHETYVNHLDPFETGSMFYFRRPCPFTNAEGMGFILCSWPDLPIENPRNQVLQTPVYPAMAFCSQAVWNNPHPKLDGGPMEDALFRYFSNLPQQGTGLLEGFAECENRVVAIRDRFFVNREFNYLRQAHVPWKIIGPFPHHGKPETAFPPESVLKGAAPAESYSAGGREYRWLDGEYTGHTIIFKHYCDYPTLFNGGGFGFPDKNSTYYALQYIYSPKAQTVPFWVSGQTWATSDWRQGPVSVPGKWFHAGTRFWVNGREIAPPRWKKPGNSGAMADENYHFREPTMIPLKKGWNQVLVKCPNDNQTRRWMFTFAPVKVNPKTPGCNVTEYPGLRFSTSPASSRE